MLSKTAFLQMLIETTNFQVIETKLFEIIALFKTYSEKIAFIEVIVPNFWEGQAENRPKTRKTPNFSGFR